MRTFEFLHRVSLQLINFSGEIEGLEHDEKWNQTIGNPGILSFLSIKRIIFLTNKVFRIFSIVRLNIFDVIASFLTPFIKVFHPCIQLLRFFKQLQHSPVKTSDFPIVGSPARKSSFGNVYVSDRMGPVG